MSTDKVIEVTCTGTDFMTLDQLTAFQGDLKSLSKVNYNKLKSNILLYGFSSPVHVWQYKKKNYILDGHQRTIVLRGLLSEGYQIPPLPIIFIKAKNVKEAKEKILLLSSQYGSLSDDSLSEFMCDSEIDYSLLENYLSFPEITLDKLPDLPKEELEDVGGEVKEKECPACGHKW
jgi:hypothetical protein